MEMATKNGDCRKKVSPGVTFEVIIPSQALIETVDKRLFHDLKCSYESFVMCAVTGRI